MHDLRTTYPMARAVIRHLQWVSMLPPLLDIYMRDPVKQIFKIEFDNKTTSYFSLVSPTRIRVVPPIPDFRRINIYVEPFSLNTAGVKVTVEGEKFVTGPERLLQVITRLWMTQPGTIMDNEELGMFVGQKDMNEVGSDGVPYLITQRVEAIKTYIMRAQKGQAVPDSERLIDLQILNLLSLPGSPFYNIYLNVQTAAGALVHILSTEG